MVQFDTKAWAGLDTQDSAISKVLLSDAFKNPQKGQKADQIDKDYLLLYGLLHCVDKKTPLSKANGLYDIL